MACDIHSFAEKKTDQGWRFTGLRPFEWSWYGLFGFLADVRNYSAVPPIAERRGFPENASDAVHEEYSNWGDDAHSASWLTVQELSEFDYDALMEDRRVTIQFPEGHQNSGLTCEPGEGRTMTCREFLGVAFFDELERLKSSGAERIVFWFDD